LSQRYWREFDPRKGIDYRAGLAVIEAAGLEWGWPQLEECLRMSGSHGFAAVSPWHPGADNLTARFREIVPTARPMGDFEFGVFPYAPQTFEAVMRLRMESGGWASGEWCIGTLIDVEKVLSAPSAVELGGFPEGWALSCAESLGCALALSEQQQSLLAMRLSPEASAAWDRLVATLPLDQMKL
jgi:hypothetical protein